MALLTTGRKIGTTLKNAARLRKIVGVFARHGFHNVAERIKLGRFVIAQFTDEEVNKYTVEERLRLSFEQLGPTFIKLGQLLATRPDLIPQGFVDEFKKLHHQVQPLPFEEIEAVLKRHFDQDSQKVFTDIDPQAIGGGSIAQVHKATLHSGEEVVIKVQRPGILEIIEEDLGVLYQLAELLQSYIPEIEIYNPIGIVDEFFRTLQLETDFLVEANNMQRFAKLFADESRVSIPKVHMAYCGREVLVMEKLEGIPLSDPRSLTQEGVDRQAVLKLGLEVYLKMVFKDGFFHGDLHAGNFFVIKENRIGLIDFGIVGRLSRRTQDSIANMLLGLAVEDYDRVAYEYVDLAPYTEGLDIDRFAKDLRDIVAPYYGLSLKNVNIGKVLMDSASIAAQHRVIVPTELMLYFKSMMAIEGIGRSVDDDFDFIDHAISFAGELIEAKYQPKRILRDLAEVGRDTSGLLQGFPKQARQLLRKLNSPNFIAKFRLENLTDIKRAIEQSSNLLFLGLLIGCLLVSGALATINPLGPRFLELPIVSVIFFSAAGLLGFLAFFNYIKK